MAGNPHALGIISGGILGGSTIGLTSKGWLVKVFESIYIPPTDDEEIRTTGPGRRGFREEEREEEKLIKITVYAYDTKWETEHIVSKDVSISVGDIEVVDNGTEIVEINVRNLKSRKR